MKGLDLANSRCLKPFSNRPSTWSVFQTQQDIWEHLGKFVLTHFPADWLAFVERDSGNSLSLRYCTLPEAVAAAQTSLRLKFEPWSPTYWKAAFWHRAFSVLPLPR